jgi:thymidylate kinase
MLEGWRAQYRDLQRRVPQLVAIDAEQPASEVLRAAQSLIWEKLRRRRAA